VGSTPLAEVGSDLDAAIAERVLGLTIHWKDGLPFMGKKPAPGTYSTVKVPPYSGSLAHCEVILERFREDGLNFAVGYDSGHDGVLGRDYGPAGYFCQLSDDVDAVNVHVEGCVTIPLAICMAALEMIKDE
jgi:hypothetical protein